MAKRKVKKETGVAVALHQDTLVWVLYNSSNELERGVLVSPRIDDYGKLKVRLPQRKFFREIEVYKENVFETKLQGLRALVAMAKKDVQRLERRERHVVKQAKSESHSARRDYARRLMDLANERVRIRKARGAR